MRVFKSILIYVRQKTTSDVAVDRAVELATIAGASLTVVQVVERIPEYVGSLLPDQWDIHQLGKRQARDTLEELVRSAREAGLEVTTEVLEGRPAIEMTRRVLKEGHDLVMKTAEREGSFLGTTATRLMRICPCPVWVVHPEQRVAYCRILVAVDVDPSTDDPEENALQRKIVDLAGSIADLGKTELHLIHVWKSYAHTILAGRMTDADLALYESSRFAGAETGLNALLSSSTCSIPDERVHVRTGQPSEGILQAARDLGADLIVIGTVARSGIGGFLIGNTAERILRQAECSVVAIKPDEFVSPKMRE